MKNILITGANSYIGTNVEKWLLKEPDKYHVETLDMKDPNWINFDFSKFDVVFHVAGIAHIKETKKNRDLYYKINRDLAVETAKKAKESGVKQFIFLSSMSVYGIDKGVISKDTIPKPKSPYGKSKYEAEVELNKIESKEFCITIVRPPIVYGPKSPGNYIKLSKLALKLPFYPNVKNQRSMLFIDNLALFIEYYIDNLVCGIQYPQNKEYVNTTEMISTIRLNNNKKTRVIPFTNWIVMITGIFIPIVRKIFGSLIYSNIVNSDIQLIDFVTSIQISEKK